MGRNSKMGSFIALDAADGDDYLDGLTANSTMSLNDSFIADRSFLSGSVPWRVVERVCLLSVFMFIALVGNSSVLVFLCRTGAWRRPVSLFVTSLAFSDILIALFSMPTEIFWELFGGWIFGNILCKGLTYVQCVLFATNAFIHMGISYDRYNAMLKPMPTTLRTNRNRMLITGSWILALVIAVPHLFIFLEVESTNGDERQTVVSCSSRGYTAEWQRKLYVSWVATYVFLIPLACITYCYARIAHLIWLCKKNHYAAPLITITDHSTCNLQRASLFSEYASGRHMQRLDNHKRVLNDARTKTVKVTACILLSYIICWAPYFSVSLYNVWTDYADKETISNAAIGILAQCLCWFSSCVNPLIYGCFTLNGYIKRFEPRKRVQKRDLQYATYYHELVSSFLRGKKRSNNGAPVVFRRDVSAQQTKEGRLTEPPSCQVIVQV